MWPLSETSCQSAASSPLGISRIPAELAFPPPPPATSSATAFRRNLFAADAGQSPPLHDEDLPPSATPTQQDQRACCLPRKKDRPPAWRSLPASKKRKTARCETRLDRSAKVRQPSRYIPPAEGPRRRGKSVSARTSSRGGIAARLAGSTCRLANPHNSAIHNRILLKTQTQKRNRSTGILTKLLS